MHHRESLKITLFTSILLSAVVFSETAFSAIVDFETTPTISNAPSTFGRAGPAQTVEVDNVLTFNGGVVLGFPSFLPSTPLITPPNLYATANHPSGGVVGDPTLSSSLSIDIASSVNANTVEGVLLNGLNRPGSYTIEAFSDETLVDSVVLNDLSPNLSSGFDIFSLDSKELPITSVIFSPDLADGEWDYFIDTIAINEPIANAVPLPASIWLFASGIVSFFGIRKKHSHNKI
jgi:hypothetical protein